MDFDRHVLILLSRAQAGRVAGPPRRCLLQRGQFNDNKIGRNE
jgi:hypothetical protein